MNKGIRWLIALAGAIVVALLFRCFAFTSCLIPSSGMENSLFQGERILVNKWSYGLRLPAMSLFPYTRWISSQVQRGDVVLFNNPANTSQSVIDRREVYISRCIGVPGDTLFVDSLFTVVASPRQASPDQKGLYGYPQNKEHAIDSLLHLLSIAGNKLMGQDKESYVRSFSRYEYYLLSQALGENNWLQLLSQERCEETLPLIVPGKGKYIRVHPWNITLLRNTLVLHEGKQAEIRNDTLYVDGKLTLHGYFTKEYYWMASNNSVNLSDSRLFGFVPHDHIIGKAFRIWFSKEDNTAPFSGYRWNRFLEKVQ